jgi:hypothetical protein
MPVHLAMLLTPEPTGTFVVMVNVLYDVFTVNTIKLFLRYKSPRIPIIFPPFVPLFLSCIFSY